jgi:hypothetical protein
VDISYGSARGGPTLDSSPPPSEDQPISFRDRSDPGGDNQTMSRFSRADVEAALSTASAVRRKRSTDVILAQAEARWLCLRATVRSGLAALASKGASEKVRVTPQVCACFIAIWPDRCGDLLGSRTRACIARRPRCGRGISLCMRLWLAHAPPLAGSRQTQVFVGVQSSASGVRLIERRVRNRSSGMGM